MPGQATTQIVQVNAAVTQAPTPATLQQQGALVSVGGTTLSTGSSQYCANLAAVTAILSSAGNYQELTKMATTFFEQGQGVGVSVVELGTSSGAIPAQITSLGTYITANTPSGGSGNGPFYAYLVPAAWDTQSADLETMCAAFSSNTSKTYFFITTSEADLSAYTVKSIFATVPSPTAATGEFQAAVPFYQWISQVPSIAAPATPMAFRFAFGVTPWAFTQANITLMDEIVAGYGNIIIPASEGGLSNSMIEYGTTMDGNQSMFWYSVDYVLVNAKLLLANAIITGTQPGNPNPIVYNQFGINQLLTTLTTLGKTAVSIGLLLSASFNATPFTIYTSANPTQYQSGIYDGFTATVTPQLGFESVTFNLDATTFT